jgi:hypothetical protein
MLNMKHMIHLLLGLSDVSVSITLFPHFYCFWSHVLSLLWLGYIEVAFLVMYSHFLTLSIADWVTKNLMTLRKSALMSVTTLTENIPIYFCKSYFVAKIQHISNSFTCPWYPSCTKLKLTILHSSNQMKCQMRGRYWYGGWIYCNHKWKHSTGQMIIGKRKVTQGNPI